MVFSILTMVGVGQSIYEIIRIVSNPILEPFERLQERFLPGLPFSFSPLFAFIVIDILENLIFTILK